MPKGAAMIFFSHSRLSAYETCPFQYRCIYLDRLSAREETVEAFLGTRVHEVLEKLYQDVLHTRLPSLKDLLEYYEKIWEGNWHDLIRIVRRDYSPEDYRKMGRKYITLFYQRHHPFDRSRTVALEENLTFSLDGEDRYGIRGVVDRIALAEDGTIEVHDYKTSSRLPSQDELDRDRQLGFYQIGVTERWPGAERVKLVWHYLAQGTEMTSHRTPEELEELKEKTLILIREIESREEFPPRKSRLCPWCLYRGVCPLFAHETWVSGLPPEKFKAEDGVVLADRYRELKKQERHAREELEKVKEKVIRYAEEQGVDVIVGHGCRLKIVRFTEASYPRKGHPDRKELEKILKEAGIWQEVSTLDGPALGRALSQSGWEGDLVERLREFEEIKEEKQVRLTEEED
jgi:putative RecB family exonuclease